MSIIVCVFLNIQLNAIDLYGLLIQPNNICRGATILPVYVLFFAYTIVFYTAKYTIGRCCTTIS